MSGRRFEHDAVPSTSDVAFAALAAGEARHGDVHTARCQTAGRGRRGRAWLHAPDEGVALSLVWLPPPPPPSPAGLTMAAGLAALDACALLGLSGARLDWPNDLVVGDAKLAGVIVESRGLDAREPHYVVGAGLNVRQARFPAELEAERRVTSLLREGVDVATKTAADALAEALPTRLEQVTHDPAGLAEDFVGALGLRGAAVRVEVSGGSVEGILDGLDLERGLRIGTARGFRELPLAHLGALVAR